MLSHEPRRRPTAVEARNKYKEYKEFFEASLSNACIDMEIEEQLDQKLKIGSNPTNTQSKAYRRRMRWKRTRLYRNVN